MSRPESSRLHVPCDAPGHERCDIVHEVRLGGLELHEKCHGLAADRRFLWQTFHAASRRQSSLTPALALEVNKVSGFIAMSEALRYIPVTFQRSNMQPPYGHMYKPGGGTHMTAMMTYDEDRDAPNGHAYFEAMDAVYGRIAYEPGGLFDVVERCLRMVLARMGRT